MMKKIFFPILFGVVCAFIPLVSFAINTDANNLVVTSQSKLEENDVVSSDVKFMPKITVTLPSISLPKVKSDLDYYVTVTKKLFLQEANETITDPENTIQPELTIICKIVQENEITIAIDCSSYEYNGGAHGTTSTFTLNYYKQGEKLITLGNLFTKQKNYLSILSKKSIAHFSTKFDDKQRVSEGLSTNIEKFNDFTITSKNGKVDTITFYFDQYQIAPYAEGRQSLTLSYPKLLILK